MSAVKWHHESRVQCYAKFHRVTVKSNHRKRRGVWSKQWPLPAGVRQHPAQTCSCGCRLRTAYRFREYQGYFCYTRLKLSFRRIQHSHFRFISISYRIWRIWRHFFIICAFRSCSCLTHHLRQQLTNDCMDDFTFLYIFNAFNLMFVEDGPKSGATDSWPYFVKS